MRNPLSIILVIILALLFPHIVVPVLLILLVIRLLQG